MLAKPYLCKPGPSAPSQQLFSAAAMYCNFKEERQSLPGACGHMNVFKLQCKFRKKSEIEGVWDSVSVCDNAQRKGLATWTLLNAYVSLDQTACMSGMSAGTVVPFVVSFVYDNFSHTQSKQRSTCKVCGMEVKDAGVTTSNYRGYIKTTVVKPAMLWINIYFILCQYLMGKNK